MKTKFTKIFALSIALIICALSLVSCSGHIKDKNGPDDVSVSIAEDKLISGSTSVTATNYDVKQEGNVYTYADEKVSGVMNICDIDPDGKLTFKVDSTLTAGNLMIYVLHKGNNNVIEGEIPVGEGQSFTIDEPSSGKYVLRIAAESANVDIKVTVEAE